jgi:hypothetical protein
MSTISEKKENRAEGYSLFKPGRFLKSSRFLSLKGKQVGIYFGQGLNCIV